MTIFKDQENLNPQQILLDQNHMIEIVVNEIHLIKKSKNNHVIQNRNKNKENLKVVYLNNSPHKGLKDNNIMKDKVKHLIVQHLYLMLEGEIVKSMLLIYMRVPMKKI